MKTLRCYVLVFVAMFLAARAVEAANQAPRVGFAAPANNAKFLAPATIPLKATATDADGTIAKVEFFNGTAKLGESLSAPYQYNWTPVAAGSYTLTLRATDNLGAVKTSTAIHVVVNTAPTVALIAPLATDPFDAPAAVLLKATASDPDGTIAKVEFYRGTIRLGQATAAPYQFEWVQAPAGTYALTAKATDNFGATSVSAPVSITINAPPRVSITSPAAAARFVAPAKVVIKASPIDSDGTVAKVEFFRGVTKLGEKTAAPWEWTWDGAPAGSYSLSAKATDNRGATASSSAVTIKVNAPPAVALTTPGLTGALVAPASLTLLATASDADGTIAKVEFFRGATKLGEATTAPYQFVWNAIPAGSYTLTARATDNAGAVITSAPILAVVDAPPKVTLTAPTAATKLTAPATITLKATASDTDGTVAHVEFYNDGTKLGQVSTAPYQFIWPQVPAGTYMLSARAVDNTGGAASSTPVAIVVNAPPTVALTAPAAGLVANAPATIGLAATAADSDGTIAKVEFFHGATKLGEATTAPYAFSWADAPAGSYALTARATDNLGATTTSAAVTVVVNALPKISLTSPTATMKFNAPATVPLKASASDPDGSLVKVEFFNGSAKVGEALAAPYQFNWAGVGAGSYSLTARATDNRGTTTVSAPVAVVVNAPPTVALTAPAAGALYVVGTTVALTATAADSDGSVAKVEFFRGTTKLGEAAAAPYAFTWTGSTAGTYALTARATDSAGAVTTSAPISVVINAPPKVSITAPANNAKRTAPATVLIKASATDSDGSVAKVEFFNGATKLGESTVAPYQYSWVGIAAGTYAITAKATDDRGIATTSAAITLLVNAPPIVALTTPATGTVVTGGATVSLVAAASDADGTIAKVEFFRGTTKLGQATAAPYQFDWTTPASGTFALTARATDNGGAVTTSDPVSVVVNAVPTVRISTPANNAQFTAPANITLRATAADSDGTVARVEFFSGSTLIGESTAAPFQTVWSGATTGSYALTARVTDNRGATATSVAVNIVVQAASGAPAVAITAPADGAVVPANAALTLAATTSGFTTAVTKLEFFTGATKLGDGTAVAGSPGAYALALPAGLSAGNYTLTAKATNSAGAVTTSPGSALVVNALPAVALTSPAAGTLFYAPATLPLVATASDSDGSIAKVEFFNGAQKVGEATGAPYQLSLADVPAGSYTFTARATDNRGTVSISAATTVAVDATPTVAISSPADGATVQALADLTLTATAADADGTIAKVEFYDGATKLGEATAAPFTYLWTAVPAGAHTLTARAIDNSGGAATSAAITLTANAAPAVALTSPAANAVFPAPAAITLAATATDSDGTVAKVEFYSGAVKIGEATTAPFTVLWTDVPAGSYVLTAKAIDDDGASTVSVAISVQVAAGNVPPTIALSSPTDGSIVAAPADITVQATAADADGTVSKVEFFNGATKVGEATAAPFRVVVPALASGVYTFTAKVTDNLGAATTSAAATVTVNALPTVVLTAPAAGVVGAEPASITLRAMASDTDGTIALVEFFNGAVKLGEATSAPYQFTWLDVAAGSYALTARATDDLGGSRSTSPIIVQVTGDGVLPTVALTSPQDNSAFAVPTAVDLRATAVAAGGRSITKVEFYSGTELIGTASSAPFQFSWTDVPAGDYQILARAYDDTGAFGDSLPVSVSVITTVTVALITPTDGDDFDGPATINLSADVDAASGAVTKVDFFSGTTLVGEVTDAPYLFTWSDVAPGTYTLTVRAYDATGVFADSEAVTVTVNAPHLPPVVALGGPADGSTVTIPAPLTLTATASTPNGSIARVEFSANGILLSQSTTAPYQFNWSTLPPGTYSLVATAYDATGASNSSDPITVTVVAPHAPPAIKLTDPVAGAHFSTAETVYLAADANAGAGNIAKVEFYGGATKLGEATSYPYEFAWTGMSPGTYAITARAYDDTGASAVTSAVSVQIGIPPTVTLTGLTDGATLVPGGILTADATTTSGAVTRVEFYQGANLLGAAHAAPWQFSAGNLAFGDSTLRARAYGDNGTIADSVPVNVHVRGNLSAVVTSPEPGLTFGVGSRILFSAVASEPGSDLSRLEFYQDGDLIDTRYFNPGDDQSTPRGIGLGLGSTGNFLLMARAFDTNGLSADSAPVTLIVTENPPPTVALNVAALSDTSAALTATASSSTANITKVEFYAGATQLATATSPPFTYTWANIPGGDYTLRARAYDDAGGVAVSTPVTFTSVAAPAPLATLPYITSFEAGAGYTLGRAAGQFGWKAEYVDNLDDYVSQADAAEGTQSVVLQPSWTGGQLTQTFASAATPSVLFVDFLAKPVADYSPDSSTGFYADSAGVAVRLTGYHGQVFALAAIPFFESPNSWVATSCTIPLNVDHQAQNWVRFTQRLDYAAHTWDLYVNGKMVAADLPLDPDLTQLSALHLRSHGQVDSRYDDLYIGSENPLFHDTAGDGIDDAWKIAHGFAPGANVRGLDLAGSGMNVAQKYVLGLDPQKKSTVDDGIPDGWKVAHGLDSLQPGLANLDPFNDGLTYLQKYLLSKLSPDGFIAGPLQDTDGDGVPDLVEIATGTDPADYYNGVTPTVTPQLAADGQGGADGRFSVRVTGPDGKPLVNAPVTLTVEVGDGQFSLSPDSTDYVTSAEVRTDANGIATVFIKKEEL